MFHSAKISTLKNYWDSQPTYYYVCLSKVACEIQKYMIVLWLVLCVNWLWITMVPSYSIQIYVLLWRYFVYGINIFNWLSLNKGDYLYNVGKRHPIIWKALRKQMRFHWERKKFCSKPQHQALSESIQPAGLPYLFQTYSPHDHISQFIEINLYWFCLSKEAWVIHLSNFDIYEKI